MREPVHLMVTSVKTTVPLPVSIQKPARLLSVQTHPFIHSMICRENISVSVPRNPAQSEMQKKFLQQTGLTSRLVQTENYDYTQAANQLSNHEIDAFFCTAGTKTTIIEELAKECPIRLLSLNETCLKKLMASSPSYIHYTIPANTYTGQDKEVTTIGVKSIL